MSFFSKGTRGNNRGRGKRLVLGLMHFDVDFEEFNQLVQTGLLDLGGKPAFPQPFAPPNLPLQPHPSIIDVPKHHLRPMHDEWETIVYNPFLAFLIGLLAPEMHPCHMFQHLLLLTPTQRMTKFLFPKFQVTKGRKLLRSRTLIHLSPLLHDQSETNEDKL
jgi:hypothetical protein